MITPAISEEDLERLSSYEYLVERAEKSNQLEKALEEKDKALGEMDLALEEKDAALAEIKEENRKLKEKLAFYEK